MPFQQKQKGTTERVLPPQEDEFQFDCAFNVLALGQPTKANRRWCVVVAILFIGTE